MSHLSSYHFQLLCSLQVLLPDKNAYTEVLLLLSTSVLQTGLINHPLSLGNTKKNIIQYGKQALEADHLCLVCFPVWHELHLFAEIVWWEEDTASKYVTLV